MISIRTVLKLFLSIMLFLICGSANTVAQDDSTTEMRTLKSGWYPWDPYQYISEDHDTEQLTGLDVELMQIILRQANMKVTEEPVSWKQHILDIKNGTRDIAAGASYSPEREKFAYYTIPYRFEENALFVPKYQAIHYEFKSDQELLNYIKEHQLHIAVVDGFVYADPVINGFINDPSNKNLIVRTQSDSDSFNKLLAGKVDGFFADRIGGATVAWRAQYQDDVATIPLNTKTPIHFMLSKKTMTPDDVQKINNAITELKKSDDYEKIISWYLYPVLLLEATSAKWFTIMEYVGTVAFAISGLLIAYRDKSTLFGALIFASLPAIGGNMIRDVILNRSMEDTLRSPIYIIIVLGTVLTGYLLLQLYRMFSKLTKRKDEIDSVLQKPRLLNDALVFSDALGLGVFTVSGVMVTLIAKVDPLWLWAPFFSFLSGAGGNILRDMLAKSHYVTALEGEFYGEISVLWGLILSIVLMNTTSYVEPEYIRNMVIVTIVGAVLTRLIFYYFKIPNIYFTSPPLKTSH